VQMNQGETSPPSLLTEADLIALMEKHGIGMNFSVHISCKLQLQFPRPVIQVACTTVPLWNVSK